MTMEYKGDIYEMEPTPNKITGQYKIIIPRDSAIQDRVLAEIRDRLEYADVSLPFSYYVPGNNKDYTVN